ncbi:MAG: arginine deiminase-related protein [Methylocystis sp.]|nr:arginine deiminase-related protein [Methylocystis sp.]
MRLTESLLALDKARDASPPLAPDETRGTTTRLLMCAPDFFGVDYVINPWMEGQIGRTATTLARAQWENLRRQLQRVATLDFVAPAPGLPDMAFTANAGLNIGDVVVVSRFAASERRGEEPLFRAFFEAQGFKVAPWPDDVAFEGAGDALLDRAQPRIWCAHGFRSDALAAPLLETIFGRETVGLRLVDPRFYHLDTCFCPLADGWLLYYPRAFDDKSRDLIERLVPARKRIAATQDDAIGFACNAVAVGRLVFMNQASETLKARLRAAGFTPVVTPLSEFLKAGGGAKCLTLELRVA